MEENKASKIETLPEEFESIEAAAEFWDSHDSADYEKYMTPVDEKIVFAREVPYPVYVEPDLAGKVREIARRKGISMETLINRNYSA